MVPIACPDWLTQRGGSLKLASDRRTWYVLLDGNPHYTITAVPVGGKLGPCIKQTINGSRVASAATYATEPDAIRGGLEDLRAALGW